MAYGATGNGSTDDTAAIAAAQQAAGSGCVLFPAGTYQVSGLTISTAGQTFKLESGATIRANASIAGPVIAVSAVSVTILGPGRLTAMQRPDGHERPGLRALPGRSRRRPGARGGGAECGMAGH